MKQVLEQYASAVIASILVVILLSIISQYAYRQEWGISQVLGAILQDSIGERAIVDNGILETYFKESILEVGIKDVYVTAGKRSLISDCFEVKNESDKTQTVYLKSVWNMEWEIVDADISSDRSDFCISKSGVYWVQICAMDKHKKEHSWVTKLLVNQR